MLRKIKNKNMFKNLFVLFSGTNIASAISLLNMSILVNLIGLNNNGVIFLALSYASIFNLLFNFQSFTALIKFLPLAKNKKEKIDLYNQGFYFDLISAIVALVFSYIFLDFITNYMGWSDEIKNTIYIINITIIFTINGVFDAILRYHSEFKKVVYANIIVAISNLLLLSIGWILKLQFEYYVYVTVIVVVIRFFALAIFSFIVLKKNNLLDGILRFSSFNKEMLKFNLYSNVSLIVDLPVIQLTPIIINNYLGLTDVSVYKILEKIGSVLLMLSNVAAQVIAPEISKGIGQGEYKKVKKLSNIAGLSMFSVGLIIIILAYILKDYWLHFVIPEWKGYIVPIFLYLFFAVYKSGFFAQYYLFIFSGFEKETLKIVTLFNSLYMIVVFPVISQYGLTGIIILLIVQSSAVFVSKAYFLKKRRV